MADQRIAGALTASGRRSKPGFEANSVARADSPHGGPSFMEDQPVKVIGEVGKRQLGLGPRDADSADEQPEPVLLVREDVLDSSADRRFGGIGSRHMPRHRFALGLAAMDAADQHL